jgi:drug/metabolite transporter (DMT)-like permease
VNLKALLHATPGRRFSALHRVRRRRHGALKALTIFAGALLIALGAILVATPGPGALAALLGAALIATESPSFARFLDRLELRLRALLGKSASGPASGPASPAPASCAPPARRRCP